MITFFSSFHKRKTFFLAILLIVFSAFTADIIDLREELGLLSCPYIYLDNDIDTGLTSNTLFEPEPLLIFRSIGEKSSVEISFLHLLPYGFRAPPARS